MFIIVSTVGLILTEARPQQIIIQEHSNPPSVNPPHLAPVSPEEWLRQRAAPRPSPVQTTSSGTRNTRQINKVTPIVKKSTHVESKSNKSPSVSSPSKSEKMSKHSHPVPVQPNLKREKKSPSVSSLPKSQEVVISSHPVAVQPNIRRERQTPSKNKYDVPAKTYSTATLEALPSTVDARRIPTPKQTYKSTKARNPIAITRYIYNSPTGEEKEGDDVFNYAYETEHGIKQR